jgi:hypothetical protein
MCDETLGSLTDVAAISHLLPGSFFSHRARGSLSADSPAVLAACHRPLVPPVAGQEPVVAADLGAVVQVDLPNPGLLSSGAVGTEDHTAAGASRLGGPL